MLNRRDFLKAASLTGGLGAIKPIEAIASRYQTSSGFFTVHPFVENHPDAVFIMKTNVDVKTNHDAKTGAGLAFARSVLVPSESGIPLTHLIPIKPNITFAQPAKIGTKLTGGTVPVDADYLRGIITDPFFVEGIINGIKELGVSASNIHALDRWDGGTWKALGWNDVAARTGITMKSREQKVGSISENEIVWVDTPNGVWFRKIPYLYPVNAPNTWLLGVSKFKAHGMGITLNLKNIQGCLVAEYQSFCTRITASYPAAEAHLNPDRVSVINANYNRHAADKIPRWDRPGNDGGLWMETWFSRTADNNLATKIGLSVVEGVYGRDGDGFLAGPNSGPYGTAQANDYMSNIIIFGKNQVYVDIIGHWLAGHEPGNMGFLHIAKEIGLSKALNPANIPVYEWNADGTAKLAPLTDFARTPLKTYYLQRNYNGGTEEKYHLCNEPFTYPSEAPLGVDEKAEPQAFVLHQNKPNPFNPSTSIEYFLPKGGNARLDVYNSAGQLVETLVDGYRAAGSHLAVWNTTGKSSGVYFYRFRSGDFTATKKMMLLK
jgi:hypothetical protein